MNFTCDNCQKRYSIADEKVRGKTVKVRCKNCQNVITVEGPAEEENTRVVSLADVERIRAQERSLAGGAAAPAAAAPAAAAPAPLSRPPVSAPQTPWDDEPTRTAPPRQTAGAPWFVMVRNKQEGPLDEAAVGEWMAAGTISARSFFWRQGMPDWKRGSDIPELAALFAPAAPPEPPPAPPEPAFVATAPPPRAAPPARREPEPQQPFYAEPEPGPSASDPEPDEDDGSLTLFGNSGQQSAPAPVSAPAPARRGQVEVTPAAGGAPLNELFSDLDLPGNRGGAEDDEEARQDETREDDRDDEDDAQQAVEDSKAARKRPVVAPRRSPLKLVLVVLLLLIILPVVALFALSALGMLPPAVADLVDKVTGKSSAPLAPAPTPLPRQAAPTQEGTTPVAAPPTQEGTAPVAPPPAQEGTTPVAPPAEGGEAAAPAEGTMM